MSPLTLILLLGITIMHRQPAQSPKSGRMDAGGLAAASDPLPDAAFRNYKEPGSRPPDRSMIDRLDLRQVDVPLWMQEAGGRSTDDPVGASVAEKQLLDLSPRIDVGAAVGRLSRALQFQTISLDHGAAVDSAAFLALHAHLEASFPAVHRTLGREKVSGLSLLYTWTGCRPDLEPLLMMAHQDVVPTDETNWSHPPFAGTVSQGFVWGRGSLDNKQSVMALLEAVERLLADGFVPERTIYLAFGHDEEVGGREGAAKIARLLESRQVRLSAVVDEGGVILSDFIDGRSVAGIGIAEKGSVSLELTVNLQSGHSAAPARRTTIGTLSGAIHRLEKMRFPARMDGPPRETLKGLAGIQSPVRRIMLSNLWLFRPAVVAAMSRTPQTDAMIRTTVAPTMISGGLKPNVMPRTASATVNFRTMPGETAESVMQRVRRAVRDPDVSMGIVGETREASPVSSTRTRTYDVLGEIIREVHPGEEVVVVPFLVPGGTDSRHSAALTDEIYRITPVRLSREEVASFHGSDERIPIREYVRLIKGYYRLMRALQ